MAVEVIFNPAMKSVYRQVMFVACQTALNFSLAEKSARWSMIFWDLEQSVATAKDLTSIQVTVIQ